MKQLEAPTETHQRLKPWTGYSIALVISLIGGWKEITIGWDFHNLSLEGDGWHLGLIDSVVIFLALWALTFGEKRKSARINALLLLTTAFYLIWQICVHKSDTPHDVVFGYAIIGLVCNLVQVWLLHIIEKDSTQLKHSVLAHMIGDALQSVLIIIGMSIGYLIPRYWPMIDKVATAGIVVFYIKQAKDIWHGTHAH